MMTNKDRRNRARGRKAKQVLVHLAERYDPLSPEESLIDFLADLCHGMKSVALVERCSRLAMGHYGEEK